MKIDNCKFSIYRRRGTAYVLVMGIALIVTVLGVGSLLAARSYQRATTAAADWEEAGTLAFSATEQAVANLSARAAASPTGWRAAYTSGTSAFTASLGRGTVSWTLVDETDGNLSADYLRPFRVYGVGTVNAVTRVYSVQVRPAGTPMDVLRTSLHASGNVTLTGTVLAGTGPLGDVTLPTAGLGVVSSNAAVAIGPMLFANVEATTITGTAATRTGTNTTAAAAKPMPATAWPTLVATYAALATPLTVAKSGASNTANMSAFLLSPAVNPYGTTVNAAGIYSLALTSTGNGAVTLTVTNGRILGTLLVTAPAGATVNLSGPVSWQTTAPNLPALIVSGTGLTVNITGSTTWLSESGMGKNFNPAGSPYDGLTNTTTTDDYPPTIGGVVYVAGSGNVVKLSNTPCMMGTVICDGTATVTGPAALAQSTLTYATPPIGFARGDAVAEVPGTWRWDVVP